MALQGPLPSRFAQGGPLGAWLDRAFSRTQSLDWAAGGRKSIALLGSFKHRACLVLTWLSDIEEVLGLGASSTF